ncbi:Pectinesterase inhibitor 12 [Cardamine amara subsp. amara]|uniref:Pectinesterase inhibitor 12 n=1 Tax=Cardamine amara subsp. amara TaxID=228776 RepID=A0ABD1BEW1_CARAN
MKFFASFIVFLLFLNGFATAQTLIQDFCKKASAKNPKLKFDFCINSLQQDPPSKAATNLKDLLVPSINTAAGQTSTVIGIIDQIIKEAKYGENILTTLRGCRYMFNKGVLVDISYALVAIKSGDYKEAHRFLDYGLTFPSGCDYEFEKIKQHSPITNDTNVLYQKILIPLSVSEMLL